MVLFWGVAKDPKNLSVPRGFASGPHLDLSMVWGSGRKGPLEKGRSNDAGSAAFTFAPWLKARAMACGSNPRALPDFRPGGGPPKPKRQGYPPVSKT